MLLDLSRWNMSLCTDTTIVQFIWMWMLVSVAHGKRIFISYCTYMLSRKILEVGNYCFTYPGTNGSWGTETIAIRAIWLWIQVSLENALIILVRYYTNMIFSNDTNSLVNYTPPLQIWICHREFTPQSLIWLNCKNEYQWPRQRDVLYHIIVRWCPFRY